MDPRVKTGAAGLVRQFELSKALYDGVLESQTAAVQLRTLRAQVKKLQEQAGPASGAASLALTAFDQKAAALDGPAAAGPGQRGGGGAAANLGGAPDTLSGIGGSFSPLMGILQGADAAPTSQVAAAAAERLQSWAGLRAKWNALKTTDLVELNSQLKTVGWPAIEIR
jgi:hypothetical protein